MNLSITYNIEIERAAKSKYLLHMYRILAIACTMHNHINIIRQELRKNIIVMMSSKKQAVTAAAAITILGAPLLQLGGSPSSSSFTDAFSAPPSSQHQPHGRNVHASPPSTIVSESNPPVLTDSGDGDDSNDSESSSPWWKDFQLTDSTLAPSVINDFPILATTFDADGKIISNFDDESKTKKRLIYLDSAATSQKPNAVTSALTAYYERANSNVHRGAHALSREATEQYEAARDKVASFINANNRNEIVFTSGATEAINLVATSLSHTCGQPPRNNAELYLQKGDEIIITAHPPSKLCGMRIFLTPCLKVGPSWWYLVRYF